MKTDLKISSNDFKKQIKRLEAAFNKEIQSETIDIYWEFLKNSSHKEFIAAIEKIIKTEFWFPSIAKIIEYIPSEQDCWEGRLPRN